MNIYVLIFSFLSGLIGSMGFGGGTVLLIYLSVFLSLEQTKAQGINLIFFIPCALLSVLVYTKQKLIKWKLIPKMILFGLLGVALGYVALSFIKTQMLSKLFGGFLIILALKEFFIKSK